MRTIKSVIHKFRDKNCGGYTLVELLFAAIVLVLVSSCLVIGVNLCTSTYIRTVRFSEAQSLASTLSTLISDELRYAKDIETYGDSLTSYRSETQGNGAQIFVSEDGIFVSTDGKVYISSKNNKDNNNKGACILGNAAYPEGYKIGNFSIKYSNSSNIFSVSFIVKGPNGEAVKTVDFQVVPLNA